MTEKRIWIGTQVKSAKEMQKLAQEYDKKGQTEPAKMARFMRDERLKQAKHIKREWL